jgi:hypothetical protein
MAPMASAAAVTVTLSSASGPSGGGNALTATSATDVFYATGLSVEFQSKVSATTACSATYTTPASATVLLVPAPKILSTKKLAFTVPALTVATPPSAAWLLCVYSAATLTTSAAATATYTVAAAPAVTSVNPATGPALGGGTIEVTGTGFTGTTTASTTSVKIGSEPLTSVKWVNATTLTGTIPAQAASSAMAVSVTNTGGTKSLAAAYTYTDGIVVSPNTVATTKAIDVDIQGVGFTGLTFSTSAPLDTSGTYIDGANAHVYLTTGDYAAGATKATPELGECLNVLVISDNELICTVDTAKPEGAGNGAPILTGAGATIADGLYALQIVSNGSAAAHVVGTAGYSQSILSSGSAFTVAPY